MTNNLTAVLQDRDLTVVRSPTSANSISIDKPVNWVNDSGTQMVTSTGAILVFNHAITAKLIELTAVLQDRDLTVERL